MTENILTQERLKELLEYNPDTGCFERKIRTGMRVRIGDIAGYTHKKGYRCIKLEYRKYKAHRLAWLYMTGTFPLNQVDHINHDRADNRFCNLREATNQVNHRNRTINSNNKSGICGVGWHATHKKWAASIGIDGINRHLGYYVEKNHAIIARWMAEDEAGFHPNHGT